MIDVGGFLFEDEATAEQARKEEEGVRFIKEKSTLNNPQTVLKLYQTLLQQKLFVTPIGLRFLTELRDYLIASDDIEDVVIPAIDTTDFVKTVVVEKQVPAKKGKQSKTNSGGSYKAAFHVALFFAIIFGLSVLGMFAIAELSDNNVNILNYREQIINEYEQWEVELKEKEEQLREWEEKLSEREDALKNAQ